MAAGAKKAKRRLKRQVARSAVTRAVANAAHFRKNNIGIEEARFQSFNTKVFRELCLLYVEQLKDPFNSTAVPAPIYNAGYEPTLYQSKLDIVFKPLSVALTQDTAGTPNVYKTALPWDAVIGGGNAINQFASASGTSVFQAGDVKIDIRPSLNAPITMVAEKQRLAIAAGGVTAFDALSGCFTVAGQLAAGALIDWPVRGAVVAANNNAMCIALTAQILQEGSLTNVEGNIARAMMPRAERLSYIQLTGTDINATPFVSGSISVESKIPSSGLYQGNLMYSASDGSPLINNLGDLGFYFALDEEDILQMPGTLSRPAAEGSFLIWAPTEASSLAYHSTQEALGPAHDTFLSFNCQGLDPTCTYRLIVKARFQTEPIVPSATGSSMKAIQRTPEASAAWDFASKIPSILNGVASVAGHGVKLIGGLVPGGGTVGSIVSMIGGALPHLAKLLNKGSMQQMARLTM